jgi:hypothetical protein
VLLFSAALTTALKIRQSRHARIRHSTGGSADGMETPQLQTAFGRFDLRKLWWCGVQKAFSLKESSHFF